MPPTNHALLSASSAARWIACPPSARLTEGMESKPSPYAAEGTTAHALCERLLNQMLWELHRGKPVTPFSDPEDAPPTEMIKAAEMYRDFIRDLWLEYTHEPSVFVEQRVDFSAWVPGGFGTCDCLLLGDGVLHIVDFKYGKGVAVSAERNPQMMCYALGAYSMFSNLEDIDLVRMTIVQPRVQAEPETWELPAAELLEWARDVLAPAAQLAWEGKGEANPDKAHCRWCLAYPQCRAWQDKYGELAGFTALPDPELLEGVELGEWLTRVRGLTAYARDLEAYALEQLLAGAEIPGWKAVEGRSVRKWSDQPAAFEAMQAAGVAEAMLYERTPVTLTQAEKLLGKKQFEAVCGAFVTRPPGAPNLAPESDSRPGIDPLAGFSAE